MKKLRRQYRFEIRLMICFFFWLMMTAAGWGQPVEQLTINSIEATPFSEEFLNQVQAYLTVSAKGQEPIPGLTAASFKALEDDDMTKKYNLQDDDPNLVADS